MRLKINTIKQVLLGIMLLIAINGSAQSCIGFTNLPTGSYAVLNGYPLGTPFHTESAIPVSLAAWHFANGSVKNNVEILSGSLFWSGLFTTANGQYIKLSEAGVDFDITATGQIANSITFDFMDYTSDINLTVNGSTVQVGGNFSDLPAAIAPGVTLSVTETDVAVSGKRGVVTLTGIVTDLVIGGQNLGIDNICFSLAAAPPCNISNMTATVQPCNNGEYNVDIDLTAQYGSGMVTITDGVGGPSLGTFSTSALPVTVGPFAGDNITSHNIVATDTGDGNCQAEAFVSPVFCALPCSIDNAIATPQSCLSDGTFFVEINFSQVNSSGSFTIMENGTNYGTFTTNSLPAVVGPLSGDNSTVYTFTIQDAQDPNCSTQVSAGPIDCPLQCSISNITTTTSLCSPSGTYSAEIDFDHLNGNGTFSVSANGVNYGFFNTGDLPITINSLNGDGSTVYNFNITDGVDPNCVNQTSVGPIDCGPECTISNVVATTTPCSPSGNFSVDLNFNHEGGSGSVNVEANGVSYGTFSTVSMPITVSGLPGDGTTIYNFLITDSQDENCADEVSAGPVNCNVGGDECLFDNLSIAPSACDGNGMFTVILDFDYENESGEFNVFGNGTDYGAFAIEDLPIELGPFTGDGTTVYEFLVMDVEDEDCTAEMTLGTISCAQPCSISGLELVTGNCNTNGQFNVTLEFNYDNGGGAVEIKANGASQGVHFASGQSSITVGPFNGDGTTIYNFTVEDTQNASCNTAASVGPITCVLPCDISNLTATPKACNDGQFNVELNFATTNSSGAITVEANGVNYGTYIATAQTSVTVGPFNGDGSTTYNFSVTDAQMPSCSATASAGPITCTQPCDISNLTATPSTCDNNGSFTVEMNFTHENGSGSFNVTGNGTNYGTFSTTELPITLGPLAGDGTTAYEFAVNDAQMSNCSAAVAIGTKFCPLPCGINNLSTSTSGCANDGTFFASLNFTPESGNGNFTVTGNGTTYGTYDISDLPISIGPLNGDGTTNYEFVVADTENANCQSASILGTVNCPINGDCGISNLTYSDLECTSASGYKITLDFDYEFVSTTGFKVTYQGSSLGVFSYGSLPLTLDNIPSSTNPTETFTICDADDLNCCESIVIDALDCSSLQCQIYEVIAERYACNDGLFMVGIDLEVENGSLLGFQVLGNGNNYGTFNYSDLPVSIGPFDGNGASPYEFVAIDLIHTNCSNYTTMDSYNCIEECNISNVVALPGDCNSDDEVMVELAVTADNTGINYNVIGNGAIYGPFNYSLGNTIEVGPFVADGQTTYDLIVSDNTANNCSNVIVVGPFSCGTTSNQDLFASNTEIYTNQATDLLNVNLAASTAKSELVIYNNLGQVQYRQSYAQGQLNILVDLNDLSSGVYICEVQMDGKRAVRKFSRMK